MNDHDIQQLAEGFGGPLSEVAVAVLVIALALKDQPGFDRKAFDAKIRSVIEGREDSMSKRMLEVVLDK